MTQSPQSLVTPELLPCPVPWCASDFVRVAHPNRLWLAECQKCCAQGPAHETEAEAATAWNTRPQPPVEGWRLVPVELTEQMVDAAGDVRLVLGETLRDSAVAVWTAMLSAAPQAPNGSDDRG